MRDPDSEVINNNPIIINRCSKIATKKHTSLGSTGLFSSLKAWPETEIVKKI